MKQNFARKYKYPIDKVTFRFQILKYETVVSEAPANGCVARGLYLEGASWNNNLGILQESEPKILYTAMPAIHFIPELEKIVSLEEVEAEKHNTNLSQSFERSESSHETSTLKKKLIYNCPVYKTSDRAGTLSTTGHSTNYILTTHLPTLDTEDHWVKRSVALISSLSH